MIKSIKLKNIATYNDSGSELSNLKKINFIYGANGCGKTTWNAPYNLDTF